MCRHTSTIQKRAEMQVKRRNVQTYKNNTEMCRNTRTTQTCADIPVKHREEYRYNMHTNTLARLNICGNACQH